MNTQIPETIFTIGHSTRSFDEFALTLQDARVELIVDVRRFPGSRRLPQFDAEALEAGLGLRDIDYQWIAPLGGRRRPLPDSVNTGWTHSAFRGYADHVYTEEFAGGLMELLMLAGGLRTAIMCAEVLWWRCHRRLIADVLVSLGIGVEHLLAPGKREPHRLAAPAWLDSGRLSYTASQ